MQALPDFLVFDGGFATDLVSAGYEIDGDPLWSARLLHTNNSAITKVHQRFLEAGSDVVMSATYQASVEGFRKHLQCTASEAENLVQLGATLVKKACSEFWTNHWKGIGDENHGHCHRLKPLTCASLGPYGAHLSDGSEYTGAYVDKVTVQEMRDWHQRQLSLLAREQLDFYLFETIPAMKEAEAILDLTEDYPDLKFIVSFSCKDGKHISHGEALSDVLQIFNRQKQVVAVGINCTSPPFVSSLLKTINAIVQQKKILVMANSGEEWLDQKWRGKESVEPISSYVQEWIRHGANWIGGCCRTTPDDIRNIRKIIQQS